MASLSTSRPAHPRSRGENRHYRRAVARARGSSPLTRGKRRAERTQSALGRLIPAHAGKTRSVYCRVPSTRAHPRSRGENDAIQRGTLMYDGSSPLTRGKRGPGRDGDGRGRLIPAHAGKTSPRTTPRSGRKAHPRSRGENEGKVAVLALGYGSSPLTRGKRELPGRRGLLPGLIPAHAGKTPSPPSPCTETRAHPRSRGENLYPRAACDD